MSTERYVKSGRRGDQFAILIVNEQTYMPECETLYPFEWLPTAIHKMDEWLATSGYTMHHECSYCYGHVTEKDTYFFYCADEHRHDLNRSEVRKLLNGMRWEQNFLKEKRLQIGNGKTIIDGRKVSLWEAFLIWLRQE